MIELLMCGFNLSCGLSTLKEMTATPKYPPDVAQLCYYFEEQKAELPDYCKWKSEVKPPRRRSEF